MLLTSSSPIRQTRGGSSCRPLVILDARVDDLHQLVYDLGSADVLVLDPATDGIEQITAALQARGAVPSLHIVSHGASAEVQLGKTRLNLETLERYAESLRTWAETLQGGDVLLYGCRVAEGALGYLFLQQLHQLTGANLAASEQRVGRVGHKRNWVLETRVGEVQTPLIFSGQLQASYSGRFETVNFSISTDRLIESEGTPFSFNFSVDGPIPPGGSVVRLEGSIPQAINQLNLFELELTGLAGQPVDVSPGQDFSSFEVTIVEPNASISLPVFNDFQDDSPQEITWTVTPVSPGTTVNNGSATVTIFDDPSEVPSTPPPSPTPEITLTSDITTLVEDEGTEVTFTISLSEPPPANGLIVGIGTGKPFALGDFDVFPPPPQASATGGQLVGGFPDNSGFNFRATAQTATITLPIFDDQDRTENGAVTDPDGPLRNDDIGEEQTTFSILPGEGYTVSSNSSVTLTLRDTNAPPPPPPNTPPVADDDSYTTDFESELTVNADNGVLDGDTDADGDPLTATIATEPGNGTVSLNDDGSFTYTPNAGFVGTDSFTYQASDGTDTSEVATVTITVEEGTPPPPPPGGGEPIVSFSTTPEVINEAEGTALVLNFSVAGEIPPVEFDAEGNYVSGGITVNLEGDTAEILQQFLAPDGDGAVQTRVTEEGNLLYRFDTSFEADNENFGNIVGGILNVFALEDGDPAEDNSDPAAAGTGFLSNFSFTITESTASITLPVSDDLVQEADQTFTYTLAEGEGYTVDANANSGTFTVTDGVTPAISPTVGVTAAPTTLIESEQTVIEVTFTTEGEIPADGLVVQLAGPPRAIAEFDVNATNPRLPEEETVVEGVVVTGGSIVGTDEVAGSLFLRITDPTATVTVPVFQDDVAEGTEVLPFELIDGEAYEVDPAASEVTVTIEDGGGTPPPPGGDEPVVNLTVTPAVASEDASPVITATFTVDGEIPEGGLPITIGGDVATFFDPELRLLDDNVGLIFEPEDGLVPINLEGSELVVGLTAPEVTVSLTLFDDIIEEEPLDLDISILEGDGYVVGDNGTATVTIVDGDSVIPGSGPIVSLSVTETDLAEGDEFTVNFEVDGEIPDGGLEVYVDGPPAALSEFDIFGDDGIDPDTDLVGIADFPAPDNDAGGFFVTLTENQASINLSVFEDGPTEGPESFTFELIDGEQYEVSSVVTYDFSWTGQIAEFSVEGEFSYDASQSYEAGIVREDDLLSLDVSFFDPDGNLLRTYTDAQNKDLYPTVNFAFDTETGEVLQDGTWDVDDDVNLERNGFMLGVGNPDLRGEIGVQSGLAFWTRPSDDKLPHLHVDDWDDELGFPIGYSTHEDVSFPTLTVADLIDNDRVGETYLDEIQDSLDEFGKPVVAAVAKSGSAGKVELTINDGGEDAVFAVESGVTSVFLDLPLLEEAAGLTVVSIDSDATPAERPPFLDPFQVGFAITEETDFTFAPVPFTPLGGTIEHDGTITLGLGDAEATVGEFSIGFDPSRVTDTASGFFVADTLEDPLGLEVLFDLGAPAAAVVSGGELDLGDADLLLAPEVATALGLPDLAGADVGDARIDALVTGGEELPMPGSSVMIDFDSVDGEPLTAGTLITDQFPDLIISTPDSPYGAMIFDSANPTGGDTDLLAPELGNVLIISEDGDSSDPDDNAGGGVLSFEWDEPVSLGSIGLLDIDLYETEGEVQLFDGAGEVIETISIPALGDNSFQELTIGVNNAARMDVILAGSGAVTQVSYSTAAENGSSFEGWNPSDAFNLVTPPPTYEGELSPGEQANADFVDQLEGQALLDDLQEGGYVIYIRHAQTERDFADQVTADVEDFSTQRVLSEFGIQQSLAIGEGFRLSDIPYDDVITSDYGRSIKTAAIAFGEYQKDSALNFLPFEDYTPEQVEEMRANVLPLLTAAPEAGTNTVIVGHDDLFEAGTDIYPDPQGIAYLLKPDGAGDFDIIANLLPEEWVELSGAPVGTPIPPRPVPTANDVDVEGWALGDSYELVTPPPTYEGELTPGEQANADFVDQLEGEALLDELQDGGHVIYIRRAQTERDFADQGTADVNDFSTQRVVSEFGVQQSLAIGEGFAINEIPIGDVITSDYARSVETAAIAFGEYQKDSALNFLPFEDYTEEQIEEMRENVTPSLTGLPEDGTNTVIVGHDDLFEAGTGIYPDPQGIAYVLTPDGQGGFEVIANLLPEEWVALSGQDMSLGSANSDEMAPMETEVSTQMLNQDDDLLITASDMTSMVA
jgi:broad specificity phosphatase PhoE